MTTPAFDHKTISRFWTKVDQNGPLWNDTPCWVWIGTVNNAGYGRHHTNNGSVAAHRYSYLLQKGEIPKGLQIDHLCRNKRCINPQHLEAVTGRVNLLRAPTFQAMNAAKTHCCNGHEFTSENTAIALADGSRVCRMCKRINDAKQRSSPEGRAAYNKRKLEEMHKRQLRPPL